MESISFLILLSTACLTAFGQNINTHQIEVTYAASDQEIPENINLTLTSDIVSTVLHLQRCQLVSQNPSVYTLQTDSGGKVVASLEYDWGKMPNEWIYIDKTNTTVMVMTVLRNSQFSPESYVFQGYFKHNGKRYTLYNETTHLEDTVPGNTIYKVVETTNKFNHQWSHFHPVAALVNGKIENVLIKCDREQRRFKRETAPTYYIDVSLFIDYKAYSKFLDIYNNRTLALKSVYQNYAYFIVQTDVLYQNISPDFNIRISLVNVFVSEDATSSSFTEKYRTPSTPVDTVDDELAMTAFANFVNTNDALESFDYIILVTGYDLTQTINGQLSYKTGYATSGTLCSSFVKSMSMLVDRGGFTAFGIAQNLAYSLAVWQDGNGNNCKLSDQYIMGDQWYSLTNATMLNTWKFSNCSVEYMRAFINRTVQTSQGKQCLTSKLPASQDIPDVGLNLPGLNVSLNDQCQAAYGNTSFACQKPDDPNYNLWYQPSEICSRVYCEYKGSCYYNGGALMGTICGSGLLCRSGACVQDSNAPILQKPLCLFGNDMNMFINNERCTQYAPTHKGACYNYQIYVICCETCKSIYRPDLTDCEYGDRRQDCSAPNCSLSVDSIQCCETCRLLSSNISTVRTSTLDMTFTTVSNTDMTSIPTGNLTTKSSYAPSWNYQSSISSTKLSLNETSTHISTTTPDSHAVISTSTSVISDHTKNINISTLASSANSDSGVDVKIIIIITLAALMAAIGIGTAIIFLHGKKGQQDKDELVLNQENDDHNTNVEIEDSSIYKFFPYNGGVDPDDIENATDTYAPPNTESHYYSAGTTGSGNSTLNGRSYQQDESLVNDEVANAEDVSSSDQTQLRLTGTDSSGRFGYIHLHGVIPGSVYSEQTTCRPDLQEMNDLSSQTDERSMDSEATELKQTAVKAPSI